MSIMSSLFSISRSYRVSTSSAFHRLRGQSNDSRWINNGPYCSGSSATILQFKVSNSCLSSTSNKQEWPQDLDLLKRLWGLYGSASGPAAVDDKSQSSTNDHHNGSLNNCRSAIDHQRGTNHTQFNSRVVPQPCHAPTDPTICSSCYLRVLLIWSRAEMRIKVS